MTRNNAPWSATRILVLGALAIAILAAPAKAFGQEYPLTTQPLPSPEEPISVASRLQFEVGGFQPFGVVTVILESDPIVLGTFTADAEGIVQIDVVIPSAIPPGDHQLKATGPGADGGVLIASSPIVVVDSAAPPSGGGVDLQRIAVPIGLAFVVVAAGIGVLAYRRVY